MVPQQLAAEVADAAVEQKRYDRFALDEIRAGRPLFGTYPPSDESRKRYQQWLKCDPG